MLYPGSLRDLLVRLGQSGLFQAKWTEQILGEVFSAIVRDQPELEGKLARTRKLMTEAIADVRVEGYEPLVASIELPDPDDRHVLAAAIACNAQVIVTANLRHFPDEILAPFDIEAQSPDEFVINVLELAPARVVSIVKDQARALRQPAMSFEELLDRLRAVGLPRSAAAINVENSDLCEGEAMAIAVEEVRTVRRSRRAR